MEWSKIVKAVEYQGSAKFSVRDIKSKYLRFCGWYNLCHNYWNLPPEHHSSCRQYRKEWELLCPSDTRKEGWIWSASWSVTNPALERPRPPGADLLLKGFSPLPTPEERESQALLGCGILDQSAATPLPSTAQLGLT